MGLCCGDIFLEVIPSVFLAYCFMMIFGLETTATLYKNKVYLQNKLYLQKQAVSQGKKTPFSFVTFLH